MKPSEIDFLASRLDQFQHPSCKRAAGDARRALLKAERFDRADAEQALCHAIWGHLDVALEDVTGSEEVKLVALRAEMAGHVYTARMALGWLTRAPSGPIDPPTLEDLGL